jgi:hypothetical protein
MALNRSSISSASQSLKMRTWSFTYDTPSDCGGFRTQEQCSRHCYLHHQTARSQIPLAHDVERTAGWMPVKSAGTIATQIPRLRRANELSQKAPVWPMPKLNLESLSQFVIPLPTVAERRLNKAFENSIVPDRQNGTRRTLFSLFFVDLSLGRPRIDQVPDYSRC